MAFMFPELLSRACHPILNGSAAAPALDLMNAAGMERWTAGAGMRYRSRRDLLDIATNPDFDGAHAFKVAAMRKTIAFPIDPWLQLGDPRLVLGLLLAVVGCARRLAGVRPRRARGLRSGRARGGVRHGPAAAPLISSPPC